MNKSHDVLSDWVHRYSDELLSWAFYKTKQQSLAEDFVQETFLSAHKNFDKFKGNSSPKTWLFAILKNKITDYYRSKFKKTIITESEFSKDDTSDGLFEKVFNEGGHWKPSFFPTEIDQSEEELLDNESFNHILKQCIEKLNEKSMLAIQLKYLEGKEGNLICQELDITPSNFWQILHRAKIQLRVCIDDNWFKKVEEG